MYVWLLIVVFVGIKICRCIDGGYVKKPRSASFSNESFNPITISYSWFSGRATGRCFETRILITRVLYVESILCVLYCFEPNKNVN